MAGKSTHGLSYTPEYKAWQTMRLRCTEPSNSAWPDYGGRGITVCDRWLDDPVAFLADMGKKPSALHEIDRIDNNAGYSPENCRWVLRSENDRNRRSNRHATLNGETLTIAGWAERLGISATAIIKRLDAGWTEEAALTTPVRAKAKKGQAKSLQRNACAGCGVQVTGMRCHACENKARAHRGNNIEETTP